MRCPDCNGILVLVDDNGAEYPETRIEEYECEECGREKTEVLVA